MFKVGEVSNYFDKIGIAIVTLDNTLSVGDRIKFVLNNQDLFEQVVESMQVEHKKVDSANRGSMIALKTNEAVTTGTKIFKTG